MKMVGSETREGLEDIKEIAVAPWESDNVHTIQILVATEQGEHYRFLEEVRGWI